MQTIKIDFTQTAGPMKPMHAVNNGPAGEEIPLEIPLYSTYFIKLR